MPRTTLDLDASILGELRRRGRDEGKSMGQVASELLAGSLHEPNETGRAPIDWISRSLGSPKVDLEDKEVVRSVVDARR